VVDRVVHIRVGAAKLEPFFFCWTVTAIFPPSSHNIERTLAPIDSAGALLQPAWRTKCCQQAGKRKRSVLVSRPFSLLKGWEAPPLPREQGRRRLWASAARLLGFSSCSGSGWLVQHGPCPACKSSSQKDLMQSTAINKSKPTPKPLLKCKKHNTLKKLPLFLKNL